MKSNNCLMVDLEVGFQKNLFSHLLKKYNRIQLSKLLNRTSSTLYHYKNFRVKSLPLKIVKKAIKLSDIDGINLKENIIRKYNMRKEVRKILEIGAKIRHHQINSWKKNIPSINELIINNKILLENWFNKYLRLINFGARDFKTIKRTGNKIKISYTNYSNSKKKLFMNYLPAKIEVDDDFQYFFGLWCGDRLGRGRFGVANKNKNINFYTKYYLNKLYQKSEFILIYNNGIKKPKLDYKINKIYCNKTEKKIKGYCVHVGIKNGIMFSFFDYLYKNLDKILNRLPNRYIFFAGLFDAEGNVSLEGSSFRWSCLNKEKVKIYIDHLKELNLFKRYDGCNLVSYDREVFAKKILPYLKHPDKINKAKLICHGIGKLEKKFIQLLYIIKNNQGITNKALTKVLKGGKKYAQIKFLERLGCIRMINYPKQILITEKGLDELQGGR